MPSVRSLRNEYCRTCNETTLHDGLGCIHRNSTPHPTSTDVITARMSDETPLPFNNQSREAARARVARLAARANARIPGGVDIEIVTRYAAGQERKDIARALGLDNTKVGNRLEAMRSRLKLASVTDLRRPNVLTAEQGGEA